jgi:hypothetical protein
MPLTPYSGGYPKYGFLSPSLTVTDPSIPYLPLETAAAAANLPRPTWTTAPPPRPRISLSALTITLSLILPLFASAVVVAAPFAANRAYMPQPAKKPTFQHVTSYRPVPTSEFAPFAQREWVNPKKPGPAIAEVRGLNLALMGAQPSTPFKQTQWPNPNLPLRLTPQVVSPNLSVLHGHVPFKQRQWDNPKLPRTSIAEVRGLNLALLSVAAVYKPVMQNDWPNPWRPAPFKHDVIGPNLVVLHDMTNVPRPFVPLDWPLPWKPAPAKQWVIGQNWLVSHWTAPESRPFNQLAWPLPWQVQKPTIRPISGFNIPLQSSVVAKPFAQYDWPINSLRVAKTPDISGPTLTVLHDMTNVPRPFVQLSWPLPWLPSPPKQWVIGAQDPLIPLPEEAARPFRQLDWVNPTPPPLYVHPVGPWPIVILTSPPPVPPPTINYQGDGKKRKKRKPERYELFADIEHTVRTMLAGPVVVDSAVLGVHAKPEPIHDLGPSLTELVGLAKGHTDLQQRVSRLQAELDAYVASQRETEEDDDDMWTMS